MKTLAGLVLVVSSAAYAQFPSVAGSAASAGQAASAMAQAQAMAMTNNAALLNATIMSQAAMINNASARASFIGQAMALQAQVSAHNAMASSMASMASMQHTQQMMASQAAMMQTQMMNMNAIMRARTIGLESAQAMTRAVELASLDQPRMMRQSAMLTELAAQSAGQKSDQTPAQTPASAEEAPVPAMPPMMIRPMFGNPLMVEKPKPSVKSGTVPMGTKVKLHSDTHYSALYYTTNGWTPTPLSAKYAGPITINGATHLQVIAMGPNMMRSDVERVEYTVDGAQTPALEATITVPADGILKAGTPVRVAFGGKEISSETAAVGDEITLLTDEDIVMGGTVIAPRGTRVNAALVIADEKKGAAPGDLVSELRSLEVKGKRVPLFGGETMEGDKHEDAVIKPGMTAMAFVSADVSVK